MRLVSSQTILSTALMMYYIRYSRITSTQCHIATCTKAVNVGRIARILHHAGGFQLFLARQQTCDSRPLRFRLLQRVSLL